MNEEANNFLIEPELEARIVALVLGEASDFETEELNRLVAERPELAAFMKEMQQVHELMQTAAAGEFESPDANWKLPTDRRNTVLAVIRGEVPEKAVPAADDHAAQQQFSDLPISAGKTMVPANSEHTSVLAWRVRSLFAESLGPLARSVSRRMRRAPARIAAGICLAGLIGLMTVPWIFSNQQEFSSAGNFSEGQHSFSGGTDFALALPSEASVTSEFADVVGERQLIAKLESFGEANATAPSSALSALQQNLTNQRYLWLGQSDYDSSMGMPGLAFSDRKSDVDLFGTEVELKQSSDRNGDASDSGVAANNLNELSMEAGVRRSKSVPGEPHFGAGGFGSGDFGADGFGAGRFGADGFGGRGGTASGGTGGAEVNSESGLLGRFDSTERGAEGLDLGSERKKEAPEPNDPASNQRGEADVQGMQVLGLLTLKDSESVIARVEEALREKESELAGSLPRSESALAAQPERNFGDDFIVGGVKAAEDLSRENWDKERSEEKGKLSGESESRAKNQTHWFFGRGEAAGPELADSTELKRKSVARAAAPTAGLNETNAAAEAFSTFSLHVSDVSFKLAAATLARGEWPEAARIRIEEFVNAFDYGDPLPGKGEKVACVVEQAIHPFVQQRNVLRVSMRTAAEGRTTSTPLHLTFVLDNSGSMERIDRQQTVRRAFTLLSQQLTPIDQVTLISFSRQPRLLGENISGTESGKLVELIEQLPSEGGTNIEAALKLAFEKAAAVPQTPGAQNRIVLLTDGAVNLGNANPESLSQMVESMRAAGIAFDAAGICAEGLNDEVLEALTRKGDGRYYLLDSLDDADDSFVQQIAGALRPSASNVKVQVEFNPARVGQYKLLGFEKHLLNQEDFRNDAVDAAEMAAAEAGVAMYQFEAKPDGEGDVGSVSVRFRDLSTGQMVEHRWPIPYEPDAVRPDQASPSLRIATSAAMLAARLRGEALGESVDWQTLSRLIDGLPQPQQSDVRVQQLRLMIEQARQLSQ